MQVAEESHDMLAMVRASAAHEPAILDPPPASGAYLADALSVLPRRGAQHAAHSTSVFLDNLPKHDGTLAGEHEANAVDLAT